MLGPCGRPQAPVHPRGRLPQAPASQARAFLGGVYMGASGRVRRALRLRVRGRRCRGGRTRPRPHGAGRHRVPFGGMLADRYPRQRSCSGSTSCARWCSSRWRRARGRELAPLVFALAGLMAVVGAPVRPATLSLVPMLARTRASSSRRTSLEHLEGLGTLVGPALGGVLAPRPGSRLPSPWPPLSTPRALLSPGSD